MKKKEEHPENLFQLKQLIETLRSRIKILEAEQKQHERLDYAWTGNLGHWYWDVKANKVSFNDLKIKTLGYTRKDLPQEVSYQFFTEKLHPEDFGRVMKNMSEHLHGKRAVYEVEYRIKAKNGSWKWFYDRGKITKRDAMGKPVTLAGIVFDITKKKAYEEQLSILVQQLEKENLMKNKFISVLAHDLRSPIGLLTSYMELMKENLQAQQLEDLKSNIDLIENISINTYDLLNTLIQWAMAKDQFITVKKEKVQVDELFTKIIGQQEKIAAKKNINIRQEFDKSLTLFTDEVMVSTILRNLMSNALKYSYHDSAINIGATKAGDFITFYITDFGIGMDQEEMNTLFSEDRFFESRKGTNGESGTGIGLNLSKNYTQQLGGSIWGKSKPKIGTTVFVKLPFDWSDPKKGNQS
jgi:PAS domain S-box-containing protein